LTLSAVTSIWKLSGSARRVVTVSTSTAVQAAIPASRSSTGDSSSVPELVVMDPPRSLRTV
jgi:hypothetical protein